ncbi:assimilatory sulfite reductase (NADPH) flavoprotein subunit [Thalassotalea sp. 1_MG-2023]|uniref:assimilatory sulfite reductase (NADPH) flavoprotein subunit n=1 Tax=Thalassotalea sp. 1_MG-2023 TaxID=3062680 RepID=UPI0026E146BF|nr:assimilatory sulfite reductase (NADPH) flavoprotein subunit [Thalassotalea sp. 1_MG-2023]MDO6425746.1 assimilatory sulfite reductase (NADPH) flavoprotein subunit [Thalassotalea sp. 1_MG-2023]
MSEQNLNQTMLNQEQLTTLKETIGGYSPLQLAWASGYLAAKSEGSSIAVLPTASAPQASATLTILYGSQTGNAKGVAKKLAEQAQAQGLAVDCKSMGEFKPKSIKNVTHLLIVASTNGEGEPPDDAIGFHEFLSSKKAPKLDHLHYSVLALGDSSYEFFCKTGKDFDEYLANLGAKQIAPRLDCDVDYDDDAQAWSEDILTKSQDLLGANISATNVVAMPTAGATSQYTKQNPYAAELALSQKITGRDSNKDVRHIEVDLGESGITYQAGDALGVWFENDLELVNELIAALSLSADDTITVNKEAYRLQDALVSKLEITQTAPAFIEFWASVSNDETLTKLASDKNTAREYAANHQVVDIVKAAPASVEAQVFVDALRKITPRLYSIASSQSEVDEEVHLTVGLVEYQQGEQTRAGGASSFLGKRLAEGGEVKVFIEHNDNFRLPQDSNTPVIMIGPGTGIAPFRAFLQERDAAEAEGDNWLFFGDQTFTQDFLYQLEWQGYLKSGLLTRLDLAFSRDQAEKIYVQDRLREQAADVYAWLERGAHIYVCGDMSRMAKDVETALIDIIAEQGNKTAEQAEQYLKDLRNDKRYQKDVY